MSKTNKLRAEIITSTHKKEFTKKKIVLNIGGKDYEVLIDDKFQATKMQKMIIEAITNYKKLESVDDSVKLSYFMFLIIKYFSDIDLTKTENFDEQLRVLTAMLDLDIFEPIISAFPEEEIKKLNAFIDKFTTRVTESSEQNKSTEH